MFYYTCNTYIYIYIQNGMFYNILYHIIVYTGSLESAAASEAPAAAHAEDATCVFMIMSITTLVLIIT